MSSDRERNVISCRLGGGMESDEHWLVGSGRDSEDGAAGGDGGGSFGGFWSDVLMFIR